MISSSTQQTKKIAADLAQTLRGGEVIFLDGELGSGKTTFVQGLAEALGAKTGARSSSFTIMNIYPISQTIPPARGGIKGGGSILWQLPRLIIIDGGEGQVHRVVEVMQQMGVVIPVIGIAKGFDRKQDRLVFDKNDQELARIAGRGKELFQKARDEAHRFAVQYHRQLRSKALLH